MTISGREPASAVQVCPVRLCGGLWGPVPLRQCLAAWESAVRATHAFLPEQTLVELRPVVRQALEDAARAGRLWGLADAAGRWCAFMGVDGDEVTMLFVHAAFRGKGMGGALLRHAIAKLGARRVDVNEDNPQARAFYAHYGFCRAGRSAVDGQGRPFPVLHLRLACIPLA